jgi:riboflavin kinase/FMN adenylyltransferase
MDFRQRLADATPDQDTVLTIGVFDGVHLGHCHLLQRLLALSGSQYLPAVITFTNHPASILSPIFQVQYLTTPARKIRLIQEQGVKLVVPLEFSRQLASVSAGDFAAALVEHLHIKGLVVGPDFALGRDRQGDATYLKEVGDQMGFWVEGVEPLMVDGVPIKSRRIRDAVSHGAVSEVTSLLGRQFSLSGTVVVGNRQGRELGFPTANLSLPEDILLPADGIYASWTIINGVRHPSATSIGVRPTFGLTQRVVEAYVIDYSGDLYGQKISVEFVGKLRDQEAFADIPALVAQVSRDVADARLALAHEGGQAIG